MVEVGMVDKSVFYGNAFFCKGSQMTFIKHFFSNNIIQNKCFLFFAKQQIMTSLQYESSIIKYLCVGLYLKI